MSFSKIRFMLYRARTSPVVYLCALSVCSVSAQVTTNLQTAETTIELQPEASAPKLVRLAVPDGPSWQNNAPQTLIASADVNGKPVKLA
ncbi:MAG TPA: hypothetical protein VGE93_04140, partial [Bryobacteraceae bacterium]